MTQISSSYLGHSFNHETRKNACTVLIGTSRNKLKLGTQFPFQYNASKINKSMLKRKSKLLETKFIKSMKDYRLGVLKKIHRQYQKNGEATWM
jgi:hypothetical protein